MPELPGQMRGDAREHDDREEDRDAMVPEHGYGRQEGELQEHREALGRPEPGNAREKLERHQPGAGGHRRDEPRHEPDRIHVEDVTAKQPGEGKEMARPQENADRATRGQEHIAAREV